MDEKVQTALNKLFKTKTDCISTRIRLSKMIKILMLMVSKSSISSENSLKQEIIEKQKIEQMWARIRLEIKKRLKFFYKKYINCIEESESFKHESTNTP